MRAGNKAGGCQWLDGREGLQQCQSLGIIIAGFPNTHKEDKLEKVK